MLGAAHTWSLTAVSAAAGLFLLWAFRRFSDQRRIALAKRKLRAHLYAFRLFADEPALIWRAQRELLRWNVRYLALMLRPAAVVLLPLAALLLHLDAVYGSRPLRAGEATLVTARAEDGRLWGRGVAVETPPLRLVPEGLVLWRVRAAGGRPAAVLFQAPGGAAAEKSVECGAGLRYLNRRRAASLAGWLRYPGEPRLPEATAAWIEVDYPRAEIGVFGFGMHWLVWFLIVSSATMLALRKRFGVTF